MGKMLHNRPVRIKNEAVASLVDHGLQLLCFIYKIHRLRNLKRIPLFFRIYTQGHEWF